MFKRIIKGVEKMIEDTCQIIETKKNAFKEIINDKKCNDFIANVCIGVGVIGILLKLSK